MRAIAFMGANARIITYLVKSCQVHEYFYRHTVKPHKTRNNNTVVLDKKPDVPIESVIVELKESCLVAAGQL